MVQKMGPEVYLIDLRVIWDVILGLPCVPEPQRYQTSPKIDPKLDQIFGAISKRIFSGYCSLLVQNGAQLQSGRSKH